MPKFDLIFGKVECYVEVNERENASSRLLVYHAYPNEIIVSGPAAS